MMKACIVAASGKLGHYVIRHSVDRGYEVVGVGRAERSGSSTGSAGRCQDPPS
jgi:putative NADH-flavin reductase